MSTPFSFTRSLMLVGAVLGILAPVFVIAIELSFSPELTLDDFLSFKTLNFYRGIIYTTPFIWSLSFYLISKVIVSREDKLKEELYNKDNQLEECLGIVQDFENQEGSNDNVMEKGNLVAMLKTLKMKYHQRTEGEEKKQWVNDGLAEFSLLSRHEDTVEEVSDATIQFLIKYLRYSNGALFLPVEKDNITKLKLTSCYISGKKSHSVKSVAVGEGLIGQCFIDKKPAFLDSIPEEYIKDSTATELSKQPSHLMVYPLVQNGKVYGILELAGSYKLTSLELEFLDKISLVMINALQLVESNEKMRSLLMDTRLANEQMVIREEEMRENVERLRRQEREYISRIETLEWSFGESLRKEWEYKNKIDSLQRQLQKVQTQ